MEKKRNAKEEQRIDSFDMMLSILEIIEQFSLKHPDADVESILSEHEGLSPILGALRGSELSRFVNHAKKQGTKMSFSDMEMGVLEAGRKDMQKGLVEVLDSLEFETPECSICDEKKNNRGRAKKN